MQSVSMGELSPELYSSLASEEFSDKQAALKQTSFCGIISQCSRMQKVFAVIEKVAKTNSTVLILGESGTGKELIAKALHKHSERKGRMVPVNCGAIPEEILESELFGHEKGAFTGATGSRVGRFQLADNGTIFLDEIGEMSPKLQVKLLRVLQEKVVEPVGSTRSIPVDVRVVAATNKDLWAEVQAGRFREDLFYRLQVVPIELPSLKERGEDVSLLASYFVGREANELGTKSEYKLSPAALQALARYSWPGNVRELENLMKRLVILTESPRIDIDELPSYISGAAGECQIVETTDHIPDEGIDYNSLVGNFESKLITMALEKTSWNKKAAARLLNLNRTTLVEKIKKKGLEPVEIEVEADDAQARSELLA